MYPPSCFNKDILNEELFTKLAPTNDDQWFWLQAVLKGTKIRVVENPIISANYVEGTQQCGLTNINDKGEKLFWSDFKNLINYYPSLEKILKKESKKLNKKPYSKVDNYKRDLNTWYKKVIGRNINYNNPITYNEKMQWLKIYDSTPMKTKLADKYLVRDWVKEKIGEEYLIPLLGVYDNFDEIDFDKLPNQFVIKCNHGCGYNIIVKDKTLFDKEEAEEKINKWMLINYAFRWGMELYYRDIQPKIIIEKYLDEISSDVCDYRFFCFNGKVEQIWFDIWSGTPAHKRKIYDTNWKELNIKVKWPRYEKEIPKPKKLNEMIMLAEKMSKDFAFVRVDFYYVNDKIYFGEMTFTSMSGSGKFEPEIENIKLGNKIKLPKLAYNIDNCQYYKVPYDWKYELQKIFSVKNEPIRLKHKIVTIFGLKFKIKRKKYYEYSLLERLFSVKNHESRNNNWYKVITVLGFKAKFRNEALTQKHQLQRLEQKLNDISDIQKQQINKTNNMLKNMEKLLDQINANTTYVQTIKNEIEQTGEELTASSSKTNKTSKKKRKNK